MLDPLHLGLHVAQTMGYDQIMNAYHYVTLNGAKAMHVLDHYGIEEGKEANCILMNRGNFYDALNERAEVFYSIHHGKIIVQTKPIEVTTHFE